jgi:hypothetical protein
MPGCVVKARHRINDCPTLDLPPVPTGTRGTVEDEDLADDHLIVDFEEPWGAVIVDLEDVTQ